MAASSSSGVDNAVQIAGASRTGDFGRDSSSAFNAAASAGGELGGATLLKLASGEPLVGDERREARRLLRRVLDHYLGGKPLKSRELFARG